MVHLFIHLLIHANSEPEKWHGIDIKRGQLITGLYRLSEATGISMQTVRTCINRLKSTNELTIKSTNKYSIITICNYDQYQDVKYIDNKQNNKETNKRTTNEQQTTNNKQEYKEEEERNIIPPTLEMVQRYCNERKNNVDADKWYSFYAAKGWMIGKNKMKDWHAAVRTWEKNGKEHPDVKYIPKINLLKSEDIR